MKEGETPTCKPPYSMSKVELVVLMKCLEENISEGFICQSSIPFTAPVLLQRSRMQDYVSMLTRVT